MFQNRAMDIGRSWSNWIRRGQQIFRAVVRGSESARSSVGLTLDVSTTVSRSRLIDACAKVKNEFFASINKNKLNSVVQELRSRYGFRYCSGSIAKVGKYVSSESGTKIRLTSYAFVAFGLAYKNPASQSDDSLVSCEIRNLMTAQPTIETVDYYSNNLDDYQIGSMIGKGCNSAVFAAKLKEKPQNYLLPTIKEEIDCSTSYSGTVSDLSDIEVISECDNDDDDMFNDRDMMSDIRSDWFSQPVPSSDDESSSVHSDFEVISDDDDSTTVLDGSTVNSSSASNTEDMRPPPGQASSDDLAVKMLFNFSAESTEEAILMSMDRECVLINTSTSVRRLPPHFNIIDVKAAMVGEVLNTAKVYEECPAVLPARLHAIGCGRNKTLFMIMKRYPCTLDDFARQHFRSVGGSDLALQLKPMTVVFSQLLEAVHHMSINCVAHRDLKTNNILVEPGGDYPRLVVTDFGCCSTGRLRSWYFTPEISKGGNACLMAPEIRSAKPGLFSFLDFAKSDLWACGAIAYEIFGAENPFYAALPDGTQLDSGTYSEQQLPRLPDYVPQVMQRVVRSLLIKNPAERPNPRTAANMVQLVLWAPVDWFITPPTSCDVQCWLVNLWIETLIKKTDRSNEVEWNLKMMFIERITINDVYRALDCIYDC